MQRDRRAPDSGASRHRLLAGAAVIVLTSLAGLAQAQEAPSPSTLPAPGPDGLTPNAVYIEADSASRSGDVISAEGTGADVMRRIAAPMIGGLLVGFLIELVFYPVIYYIYMSISQRHHWTEERTPTP